MKQTRKRERKPRQPSADEQACANPRCGAILPAGPGEFCPECRRCWPCCDWCILDRLEDDA